MNKKNGILISIMTFFIGVIGTLMVVYYFYLPGQEVIEKTVKEVNITETNTIKEAVDKVYDAVVVVNSLYNGSNKSLGTGVVYKVDEKYGYILTNNHVISGSTSIQVMNNNEETYDATLLGSDEYADLAVLRVDKEFVIITAKLGDSTILEIGDTVFTVGTPVSVAYRGTVTKGIISGKDRQVTVTLDSGGKFMMEVLQTNAAINPGNSGGPLVNINGEIIGINTLKLVQDEIEGMGFAIPIEMVTAVLDRLEAGEKIERPLLGITLTDVTDTYNLYRNQIMLSQDYTSGVVVISVENGSAAEVSGFKKGDVISKIDDTVIKDSAHFKYILYKYSVGDTITVEYYRNGDLKTVEVKLKDSV